jgi:hypothetical protein
METQQEKKKVNTIETLFNLIYNMCEYLLRRKTDMAAEQRISASAFTHRGEAYDFNSGNFILDGRQPFDFELDNSRVSIIERDRNFFFSVCDTRVTDDLNESVSGIKELKKLHAQLKSGTRDIKSKTEILGECFMGTENLLYDTAAYSDADRSRHKRRRHLSSLDKKLVTHPGMDVDEDVEDLDDEGFDGDGGEDADVTIYRGSGAPGEGRGQRGRQGSGGGGDHRKPGGGIAGGSARSRGSARGADDGDDYYDEYDDGEDDGEDDEFGGGYEDDDDSEDDGYGLDHEGDSAALEPGQKGFSAVGFILGDRKGSILAQG